MTGTFLKVIVLICNIFFCQIAMRSFTVSPLQSFYLNLDFSGSAALGLEAQTTHTKVFILKEAFLRNKW